MSIGKRLIDTGAGGVTPSCTTDTTDIFGDGHGIALYSLDYDASTAPDATTDYSGTPSNVEFGTDGHINWGARFNGGSSYISIPQGNLPVAASARTVSLWIKTTQTSSAELFGYGVDGTNLYYALTINASSGKVGTAFYANDHNFTASVIDGNWHHIVSVYNGNILEMYVDGNSVGSSTIGAVNTGSGGTPKIGKYNYTGDLDQVRIFSKALNSTEVGTLYAETACVYTGTTQSHLYGCVANYNFDSDAKEAMGVTAYDGTESNITYEFGRFGAAAVFNGSNSFIDTNYTLPADSTMSFSFWINVASLPSDDRYILSDLSSSGTDRRLDIRLKGSDGAKLYIDIGNGTSNTTSNNTGFIPTVNTWYNIVVTLNGTSINVYINNGTAISMTSSVSFGTAGARSLSLGRAGDYNGAYYNGSIDQVRIFGSALTTTQVSGLFNDEKQAYITKSASDPFGDSSEVAFYKMENNANDSTGSNNGSASYVTFSTTDALFDSYSAVFNGSNSNIDTNLKTQNVGSHSVWFKADANPSGTEVILASGYGSSNKGINILLNTSGQIRFQINDGGGSPNALDITTTSSYADGNYHNIVATWDLTSSGTNSYIYIDGSLATSGSGLTSGWTSGDSTYDIFIGAYYNDSQNFNGSIDQIRIFNRVLEGDEVFKLYAEVIN